MKSARLFIIVSVIAAAISLTGCSADNTATVRINLGLPALSLMEQPTIFDRIAGFFIEKAYAQSAPAGITKIRVRITGAGGVNEWEFNPSPSVSVVAPAGNNLLLEVFADVDPAQDTAVLTFRGAEQIDLKGGETKEVSVQMLAWETKVIICEPLNNQMIQITNFSNPNKIVINSLTGVTLEPWDIDFDAIGRIYIANNSSSDGLVRINNFVTTGPPPFELFTSTRINALAIDRKRNLIYFATIPGVTAGQLLTNDVNFSGANTVLNGIMGFTGDQIVSMTVDEDGMLYIAYDTGVVSAITKFNPFTNSHVGNIYTNNINFTCEVFNIDSLSDINYWDGSLFVANKSGADNYRVLRLNTNLELIEHYGIEATMVNGDPDEAKGHFYGAHHFAAIRRDGLYIIDEYGDSGEMYDKLVFMENIKGDKWSIFPDTFRFYYDC